MAASAASTRCGIDTVEIARIERMIARRTGAELSGIFTAQEVADAGDGAGRVQSLAARFAAKEACAKLFPRELALGEIEPCDFSVARDAYGAPRIVLTDRTQALLDRHRLSSIAISLTHDRLSASAVALAVPAVVDAPLSGRILYKLLPIRRTVILDNLRRVFGKNAPTSEIEHLAKAHYAHIFTLAREFLRFRWMSLEKKRALVRIENVDTFIDHFLRGQGVLILTGHFGNWEVATVAGLTHYPEVRGRFHFVRRPIKPRWLDALVTRRFNREGFGVIGKRGSLDRIVSLIEAGDVIVFPFDQSAAAPDGIDVEFFGEPAGTFKSLAIIALATGAPVMPAVSWREPDGTHVLRFEEPLALVDCDDTNEAIRRNTRVFNAALERLILRHPEQWWWVHRRWKRSGAKERRAANAPQKTAPAEVPAPAAGEAPPAPIRDAAGLS
jgi:KDO2-lipid IV(A) lauroyltransferase